MQLRALLRDHLSGRGELTSEVDEASPLPEHRWPMAGAVLSVIAITMLLPDSVRLGPVWLLPVFEACLLVALTVSDPGKITRRTVALRAMSIGLVVLLALGSFASTAFLIDELVSGGSITNDSGELLSAGVTVWTSNALAFALLYWELDGQGPATRALELPQYPDLAFPQLLSPKLAPLNWRPRFIDYLYLSVTNSLAFSPTDTMPLVPWAKVGMGIQSLVSFAIMGLVVARAVNVFS